MGGFAWRIFLQVIFFNNGTALIDAKSNGLPWLFLANEEKTGLTNGPIQRTVQETLQPAWLLWLGLLTLKAFDLTHAIDRLARERTETETPE